MSERPDSPIDWTDSDQPRSRLYGDVYFSAQDGLAETRAVFLDGCGLPDAWAGRRRFVVGELGFGTGLNIAALLDLWRRHRPADGVLHIFTVEAHPISAEEARRALAHWPELAEAAGLLTARWPGRAAGVHRVDLPEFGAVLDVFVGEVADALSGWQGLADAWFLDGFSPALNPQMWSPEIMQAVADRSAPGARAATFTVAGAVRRGLADAGYAVERQPGFGRKRQRLEARFPGEAREERQVHVAIIGAGIAGAAAARAVSALGGQVTVIEAETPGAGASGNPAALVTPRLDAGLGPPARLFAQAFRRAVQLLAAAPDAILASGVLQLAPGDRDLARFAKIAAADLFEPCTLSMLDAADASAWLGEAAPPALDQTQALVVAPADILAAWAPDPVHARVTAIVSDGERWRLTTADGDLGPFDAVIVTGGADARFLLPALPLRLVRGQASWVDALDGPRPAAAWGGYAAPTADGLLFGATHDRDDAGREVRDADHARNLETLATQAPELAARITGLPLQGRASTRATTPDRLPIAGALAPGLFFLGGMGSRGFSFAPLLAEHVAALALGAPSPLPGPLGALVEPDRFARRAARS